MRVRKASSKYFKDSTLGYCQFSAFPSLVYRVSMQISAKYFTCPQFTMFSCAYLWQLICWAGGVATHPQINSTTLKQESIGILKKTLGRQGEEGEPGGGQLELQLHARAISWRVDLENKVYLVLPLDMSLLDRLASSGSCFMLPQLK